MGQNASPEGRAELRRRGTRLVGSVAYFPEKYGAAIVGVALDILHRRPVPPAVFANTSWSRRKMSTTVPERRVDARGAGHQWASSWILHENRF